MDRIAALESFIKARPDDPFPRYGLAMEHRSAGRLAEAQAVFDELAVRFPDYLATYLMSGNNLVDLGRREEARKIYERGIQASQGKGDGHTASELQSALAEL